MRYSFALAAVPALVLVWAVPPASRQPTIKAVVTEGVRAQRQDTDTFGARWRVVSDLPPATVIHEVTVAAPSVPMAAAGATVRLPLARTRRVAMRGDVCARHGLRRVEYSRGKWRGWRCRK